MKKCNLKNRPSKLYRGARKVQKTAMRKLFWDADGCLTNPSDWADLRLNGLDGGLSWGNVKGRIHRNSVSIPGRDGFKKVVTKPFCLLRNNVDVASDDDIITDDIIEVI